MKTDLDRSSQKCHSAASPSVWVVAGPDPYENAREVLRHFDLSGLKSKRVLLKPNAGRVAAPGQGVTTDPRVVAAAMDAFLDAGAEVSVGESPITGVRALEALEATGIAAVARERGCPLLDLDRLSFVEVKLPEGQAIPLIQVCSEVLEHDWIVSIPVMKTHMHTGVTLSVKNMKGCLWRRSKVYLHMLPKTEGALDKPLDVAIADLSWALRPQLALIDGTVGMEGLGPSAGDPKALGAVVASTDPFAADAVACRLMGLRAEDIPHLRLGSGRGYGVIDLEAIRVEPEGWQQWASPFSRAPANLSLEFPDIRILDSQSCSACQSTLLLLLKRHGDKILDYFGPNGARAIAIGKGHEDVPVGTLCIGNCTARHQDKGLFVPGCPPVGSLVLQALRRGEGEE